MWEATQISLFICWINWLAALRQRFGVRGHSRVCSINQHVHTALAGSISTRQALEFQDIWLTEACFSDHRPVCGMNVTLPFYSLGLMRWENQGLHPSLGKRLSWSHLKLGAQVNALMAFPLPSFSLHRSGTNYKVVKQSSTCEVKLFSHTLCLRPASQYLDFIPFLDVEFDGPAFYDAWWALHDELSRLGHSTAVVDVVICG